MFQLGGLLILVLDIVALVSVFGAPMETRARILWIILILVLPLLGPILWFLLGRSR